MPARLIIVLILVSRFAIAQTARQDFDLVLSKNLSDTSLAHKRTVSYVFKDRNWLVKYNPLSLVFGSALLFYQGVISPQIMQGCAFNPSCSNFSKQCIRSFGLIPGIALSADRLTRCTRLSSIDFHPVLFDESGKVNDVPDFYRLSKQ